MKRSDFLNEDKFVHFSEYELKELVDGAKVEVIEYIESDTFVNFQLLKEEFGSTYRMSQVLTSENSKPEWGEWIELEE